MTTDSSYYAPGVQGDPQKTNDLIQMLRSQPPAELFNNDPFNDPINAPLAQGGMDLSGSYGTGLQDTGYVGLENTTDTTGYNITGTGTGNTGLTPMDLPDEPYDNPYGDPTPTEIPPIYDPPPPYDPPTPRDLPIPYNPTTPTRITNESYTPLPQGPMNLPQFAFNFPMPNINPLMGGPNMGPVGFYSANSGAAGLPVPAFGGIENPNMLSNYVQQFVGGPDVLTRALS